MKILNDELNSKKTENNKLKEELENINKDKMDKELKMKTKENEKLNEMIKK